jgi:hypothetical protein
MNCISSIENIAEISDVEIEMRLMDELESLIKPLH